LLCGLEHGGNLDLTVAGVFGTARRGRKAKCFKNGRKRAKNKGGSAVNGFLEGEGNLGGKRGRAIGAGAGRGLCGLV
jgi:hypothetical protein